MAVVNIKEKLALDVFKTDRESHIKVDHDAYKKGNYQFLLYICPAKVYSLDEQGELRVEFEACLECGTCLITCPEVVTWNYPRGGFGIQLKYG